MPSLIDNGCLVAGTAEVVSLDDGETRGRSNQLGYAMNCLCVEERPVCHRTGRRELVGETVTEVGAEGDDRKPLIELHRHEPQLSHSDKVDLPTNQKS